MKNLIKQAAQHALDYPESQSRLKPLIQAALDFRKATGISPIDGKPINHGYDQPLAGGTDVMKRLQDQLLIEQGRATRDTNPRLAAEDMVLTVHENIDWTANMFADMNLNREAGALDNYLSGEPHPGLSIATDAFDTVRDLTDKHRMANALELPVESGTRVEFAGNMGAVLAYENPPEPKSQGTVVTVRSASGDITEHGGMVFVSWDDGVFRPIHAEHLRASKGRPKRQASPTRMRVASLGDLTDFLKLAEDTLIHRSTHDLWSLKSNGSDFIIERLFDESGDPLKG
jgi:hypothetical protein